MERGEIKPQSSEQLITHLQVLTPSPAAAIECPNCGLLEKIVANRRVLAMTWGESNRDPEFGPLRRNLPKPQGGRIRLDSLSDKALHSIYSQRQNRYLGRSVAAY